MITCDITRATVRDQLAFLEVSDFRYFKSLRQFRRKNPNGTSYITVNVVSHSPGTSSLAFYLAVQIAEVESKKKELLEDSNAITHYDCTIRGYTVNFGPGSPHWDYPVRGMWSFGSEEELWAAREQIQEFTRDLSLPYVSEHIDPAEIRHTLLTAQRRTINFQPYREILTIDLLYFGREKLRADLEEIRHRYESMCSGDSRADFERFSAAVLRA